MAVDGAGNLYIADSANSRVLEFDLPIVGGTRAGLVFGQDGSFSSANCNLGGVSANSLCRPTALAVDGGGNLYVGDHDNFRVLEYNTPLSANNTTGDLVFGQNNSFTSNINSCAAGARAGGLCTPDGVAVDNAGNLYITGSSFSRVLEYNAPLITGHTLPDAVIGQPGFSASSCNNGGLGPAGLCAPFGAATDSAGNLFVADFANNRVVQYNNPPPSPAAPAAAKLVLGQIALNQNGANGTKSDGLYWPAAVVVDTHSSPNHIYLADTNNSRVLGWLSVPGFKYAGPPDLVIGQPGAMAGGCNQNRIDAAGNSLPAADTLCQPGGVAVDPSGNLYIADSGNFRVLEYDAPFSSGQAANLPAHIVFGQSRSFTTRVENKGGVSANSMARPGGLATDQLGHLYVSDPANCRVLEYDYPASGDTTADAVFGQGGSFTGNTCNFDGLCNSAGCFATANALCGPSAVTVDSGGRLFVADSGNNRVLIFDNPGAPAKSADSVIGQADFIGVSCGTLCNPEGVASDGAGGLFAADTGQSVVNHYRAPLHTAMTPDIVIGQALCDQAIASDATFCSVAGLAFDPAGYLYAADTINNRVLTFDLATPAITPTPTSSSTPTPTASPTPAPGEPSIGAIPAVIRSGATFTIDGSGFTEDSKVNFFVATAAGPINSGPLTPGIRTATQLTVAVAADNPLGQGVVAVQVVNTDRGFLSSNVVSALLQGNPAAGIPSITGINAVPIAADSTDPDIAVANVETVVVQGRPLTIDGNGFDIANGVAVDVFCACPRGKVGPFFLKPGNAGLTSTSATFTLPASGPATPPDGPGSFVVSNQGSDAGFSRKSNAVAAPLGQQITVTAVSQSGTVITVNGTGFSVLTVINLFNAQAAGLVNLGGLQADGTPRIPLTLIDGTSFTFSRPSAATAGPGYVQALNPPFVPFSSSGNGSGGSFIIW